MKIACLFLLLVGLAAAKPSPSSLSFDHTLFLDGNFTKAELEVLPKQREAFLEKYEVIIPADLVKFIRNVTVDDYDALNRMIEIRKQIMKDGYEALRDSHFEEQYPDMSKRLEELWLKFLALIWKVSKTTRNRATKAINLYEYVRNTRNLTDEENLKILLKEYLRWPQKAKEEVDKIFPKLSTKTQEWPTLADDDSIPSLDSSLCRNVDHVLCEAYQKMVAEMYEDLPSSSESASLGTLLVEIPPNRSLDDIFA